MQNNQEASFLEKYGKPLAIAGTIGTGLALAYAYFAFTKGEEGETQATTENRSQTKAAPKALAGIPPKYIQALEGLRGSIGRKIESGENLDVRELITILTLTGELATPDFVRIYSDARTQRRAVKDNDLDSYAMIVMQSLQKIEELMDTKINDILMNLGVPLELYQTSCEYHAQSNQQFAMLAIGQMEMIKANIPSNNSMDVEGAKTYLQFMIDEIPKIDVSSIQEIQEGTKALSLKALVDDLAFDSLGYEEEDFTRFMKEGGQQAIMGNPQLMQLIQQMQMVLQQSMMSYGAPSF